MLPLLQHELNRAHVADMQRETQGLIGMTPKPVHRKFSWLWLRRKSAVKASQAERELQPVF